MDNYLIMGHLLQCKVIPKDKVHSELWVGANRKWRVVPRARVERVTHNKVRIKVLDGMITKLRRNGLQMSRQRQKRDCSSESESGNGSLQRRVSNMT